MSVAVALVFAVALGTAGCAADGAARTPASAPSAGSSESGPPTEVVVLADPAFAEVFPDLATAYEASRPGIRLVVAYDRTELLGERIAAGAPADLLLGVGGEVATTLDRAGLASGPPVRLGRSPDRLPCIALAVTGGARGEEGAAFVRWLRGAGASSILAAAGFDPAP